MDTAGSDNITHLAAWKASHNRGAHPADRTLTDRAEMWANIATHHDAPECHRCDPPPHLLCCCNGIDTPRPTSR